MTMLMVHLCISQSAYFLIPISFPLVQIYNDMHDTTLK